MLFSIALKLVIGFIALLVVIRSLGKKAMSEVTPFDLIYTLVLGGILEETIYDDKVNIGHLLFAVILWAVLIYIVERFVQRNDKLNRWIKGEPSVLMKNGELNLIEISKNHIEMEQLRAMLRQQECFSLENAKHVILENAGQVSLIKESEEDKVMTLMFVDEGLIQDRVLQTNNLNESWLRESLTKEGYKEINDLLYVEWSEEKGFYILTQDDVDNTIYRIDG